MNRKNALIVLLSVLAMFTSVSATAAPSCGAPEVKQLLIDAAVKRFGEGWGANSMPTFRKIQQVDSIRTVSRDRETGTSICSAYVWMDAPKARAGGNVDYMVTTNGGRTIIRYNPQQMLDATTLVFKVSPY